MIERSARALLGVSPSATTGQIKRAYRRLALEVHPDRGGDPVAFQQLVDAQNMLLATCAAVRSSVRPEWVDTSVVRLAARPQPAPFSSARRRPACSQVTPARNFGDVLAEKLSAA